MFVLTANQRGIKDAHKIYTYYASRLLKKKKKQAAQITVYIYVSASFSLESALVVVVVSVLLFHSLSTEDDPNEFPELYSLGLFDRFICCSVLHFSFSSLYSIGLYLVLAQLEDLLFFSLTFSSPSVCCILFMLSLFLFL